MKHYKTSPTPRPDTRPEVPALDEILEEVRQLRASMAAYRRLVERLIVERDEAA